MDLLSIQKILEPIKRKMYLLIGRAILTALDNSEGTQKIQVDALSNETISDMERFEEYGFTSYPKNDAEVLALFQNGNRDQGIAICIHDRDERPTDLNEGEVCLYDENDSRVYLKNGSELHIYCDNQMTVESKNNAADILASKNITIKSSSGDVVVEASTGNIDIKSTSGTVNIESGTSLTIKSNGNEVNISGTGALEYAPLTSKILNVVNTMIMAIYNSHVHLAPLGGNTGTPSVTMTNTATADYESSEVKIS